MFHSRVVVGSNDEFLASQVNGIRLLSEARNTMVPHNTQIETFPMVRHMEGRESSEQQQQQSVFGQIDGLVSRLRQSLHNDQTTTERPHNAESSNQHSESKSLEGIDVQKTERILVVDDDPDVRRFISSALALAGFEVLEASSANEAIEYCQQEQTKIDLLVADVVMSEMSGWKIASKIVALRPDVKVLFVSGYPESSCLLLGLDIPNQVIKPKYDFIQKPFARNSLLAKVRQVLNQNA